MKYISTIDNRKHYTLSQAMLEGLAPDGGLFIPETFPKFNASEFSEKLTYSDICYKILKPFFAGDALINKLHELCRLAFNFDVPLKKIDFSTYIMELFHGPTLSFKDFGARFLAACLNELTEKKITIMVATSGDTGSAVAAAFYKKPHIDVIVLFPNGQISKRQQQQMTCWGENVYAFAIDGTFDDCQRMVKSAFSDAEWQKHNHLCTANSINIGRLLPQTCYYAYASLNLFKQQNIEANFIVPSGNLGNVTAAYWAKKMGFPINRILIATNANRVVSDYIETGHYQPRQSIHTLANAMDVGEPSNFERLIKLFSDYSAFKKEVVAYSVSDDQIKQTIKKMFSKYNTIVCPHTATGCWARERVDDGIWIIAGTAHPCKFETVIEPIIQQKIPIDTALSKMLDRKSKFILIEPKLELITEYLKKH